MEQAISSDLIRGHIDTIILHTLLDGDKYAQQIIDTVDLKSEKQYQLNQATLYSSLKRLENLGYVKSYWFDAEDGRRKFIKITEKGKDFVDSNLTNWAFSRAIIDKLMNVQPEKVVPVIAQPSPQPSVNYSVSERQNANFENSELTDMPNDAVKPENIESVKITQEDVSYTPVINNIRNQEQITESNADVKEINFRNILNGIIKATAIQKNEKEKVHIEELDIEHGNLSEQPIQKFADTLDTELKDVKNRSGKIDFSDLVVKAEKEGYKVRVSSKSAARPKGNLYENKLQFFSVLCVVILAIIESMVLFIRFKNVFSDSAVIIGSVLIIVLFTFFLIKYIGNPKKTRVKPISGDRMLTCAIVLFNLLLITFALNFLLNVNFTDKPCLIKFIFVPCIIFFNSFAYFIFEFLFSKTDFVKVKTDDKNK